MTQRCANCGHTEPHNGPAGAVDDACTHPMCKCGYFVGADGGSPPMTEPKRELDRELLRQAGEHLGTLAEQARERYDLSGAYVNSRSSALWDRYARLARLSREVLEVANP